MPEDGRPGDLITGNPAGVAKYCHPRQRDEGGQAETYLPGKEVDLFYSFCYLIKFRVFIGQRFEQKTA